MPKLGLGCVIERVRVTGAASSPSASMRTAVTGDGRGKGLRMGRPSCTVADPAAKPMRTFASTITRVSVSSVPQPAGKPVPGASVRTISSSLLSASRLMLSVTCPLLSPAGIMMSVEVTGLAKSLPKEASPLSPPVKESLSGRPFGAGASVLRLTRRSVEPTVSLTGSSGITTRRSTGVGVPATSSLTVLNVLMLAVLSLAGTMNV